MNSRRIKIENFSIVDFCFEIMSNAISLADVFKVIHDRYGWRYADIHAKFKREIDSRNDVYITRTSDIYVRGVEHRRLPIYENQWYSHLFKK